MADRNWADGPKTLRRGLIMLTGYCTIHTDGTVLTSVFTGGTFTGDTGVYTLTLDDAYISLAGCHATMFAATAVDLVPQIKSEDVVTAKTVVFNVNAGATPTDPSAACRLYVTLYLNNSDGN